MRSDVSRFQHPFSQQLHDSVESVATASAAPHPFQHRGTQNKMLLTTPQPPRGSTKRPPDTQGPMELDGRSSWATALASILDSRLWISSLLMFCFGLLGVCRRLSMLQCGLRKLPSCAGRRYSLLHWNLCREWTAVLKTPGYASKFAD